MSLKNQSKLIIACLLLLGCKKNLANTPSASAAMSTLVVTSDNVADGLTPAQVTLLIRTASGEPVQGARMALLVSGSQNVVIPCGLTDHRGFSQCRIFSTKAEQKTIVAKGIIDLKAQTIFAAPNSSFSRRSQPLQSNNLF